MLAEEAMRRDPAAPMAESLKKAATTVESKADTASKEDTTTRNIQVFGDAEAPLNLGAEPLEQLPSVQGGDDVVDGFLDDSAVVAVHC